MTTNDKYVYVVIRRLDYVEEVVAVFDKYKIACDWMEFFTNNPELLSDYGVRLSDLKLREMKITDGFNGEKVFNAKKTYEELVKEREMLDKNIVEASQILKNLVKPA
jgi:hypothetical protein